MKFCEKTKLHRRLDAVYIAIFIHVLYCANSFGGGIRREEENVLFVRRRGWKWFVYIFSLWNFPNSHSPELDTREQRVERHEKNSLIRLEHCRKLFDWDSAFPRAVIKVLSMWKICFGLLRFTTTRWFYSNENFEWLIFCEIKLCFVYDSVRYERASERVDDSFKKNLRQTREHGAIKSPFHDYSAS